MRWKYYPLADDDRKAKTHILGCFEVGAFEKHALTTKLLGRFSEAGGPIFAIAFESLDLNGLSDCRYDAYVGGKSLDDGIGADAVPDRDFPIGGLALFVEEHLRSSDKAVVLCEEWLGTRRSYLEYPRPRESRVSFFGEDVYQTLTSENADFDSIEAAFRQSGSFWSTSVCSRCDTVPSGEVASEEFLDSIVAATVHIITSAFHDHGYLVWSPTLKRDA